MRTYEAVLILASRGVEDGGETFAQDVTKYVQSLGGVMKKRVSVGRKQFSYPIKKQRAGIYWHMLFDLDPAKTATLQDRYKLNNTVLRLEVFRYEEPPKPAKPSRRPGPLPERADTDTED